MDLYYLSFNNYYNRQLKVLGTLSEYLKYVVGQTEGDRNFNPANDITVKFISNRDRDEIGDYMLAVDDGVIVSRWYILNGDRTRQGQYQLTVRRDVLADYYTQVLTAPCFIEKATLDTGDPMIFNKEDMTVNQIKTSETLLKDRTGCAWVVGYIPNNAFSTSTTITSNYIASDIKPDAEYTTLDEFPYYTYINTTMYDKPFDFKLYTSIKQQDPSSYTYRKQVLSIDLFSGYIEQQIESSDNDYSSGYYISRADGYFNNFSPSAFYSPLSTQTARDTLYNSVLPFTLYYTQNSSVDVNVFHSWDNKIIKVGTGENAVYYRVNVYKRENVYTSDGSYPDPLTWSATLGTQKFVPYLNLTTAGLPVYGSPDGYTFETEAHCYGYRVRLTQIFNKATVTLDSDRSHLEDSPYDMFCIPYSDEFVIKNNGVDFCTANKSLALNMATEIGKQSGQGTVYDIQLLPYCPIQRAIKANGDFDIINEKYDVIKDATDNALGVVIWCNTSTFTFDIDNPITISNPKVSNQCDLYRLVSPNYNGQFEFNVAMNGGMTKFNVDCAYKPFNPYIHINPDFGLLYGSDFNDARGLICGGDFSLPQVSDPWANYQLQNKNYQAIFDRQIQNMQVGYKYQNLSQLISGSISAISTGVTTGVLAGGPFGALSGLASVGGLLTDYYFNRRLQNEAIDYTKDLFGYKLGNIQALPDSLTKVSPFNPNNKLFPFLEYYTCTPTERQAFENKIRWNGMTVMRIGTIQEFIRPTETYIKGQIIRLLDVDEPTNVLNEIANEINKGVFIDGGNTTGS